VPTEAVLGVLDAPVLDAPVLDAPVLGGGVQLPPELLQPAAVMAMITALVTASREVLPAFMFPLNSRSPRSCSRPAAWSLEFERFRRTGQREMMRPHDNVSWPGGLRPGNVLDHHLTR
jgi:hypothetical protein